MQSLLTSEAYMGLDRKKHAIYHLIVNLGGMNWKLFNFTFFLQLKQQSHLNS